MKKSLLNLASYSLAISAFLVLVFTAQAQVRVPFAQRTSAFTPTQTIYSIHGDFTMIGNTNMTLVSYSDTEPNSNNDMKKVDTDGISSTNNSSAATLVFSNENGANPACSEVLFAGLYWTARTNATPTELQKRTIKFRGPGESNYTTYTATTSDIRYPGDNSMYAGFVEVTEKVQALGAGQYWAADMALTTGDGGSTGYYGGWGMVVVYGNSKMQKRDITIFDGYAFMDGNQDLSFELPVSGFNSTLNGPVNMKLGMMAGEGDVSISGDQFEIQKLASSNWQLLNHGGNSTTNFFNSSIFTGGNARNPSLLNNTGMDISMFDIPNPSNTVIANGQSNTKFRYSSTQDTYIIHSICMAVDAYEPAIEGFLSTVSVNGTPTSSSSLTVLPGDEITYNVKIRNRGNEPVNNTRLEIPLPYSAVTYLGSTVNAYPPASSSTLPLIDFSLSANGTLVWDFGTLPVPADEDDVLGEITFALQVSEDCELFRNFNCSAPTVEIDGTISGVGANTGIAVEDQRFYVGFSATNGCSTEPVNGPFTISINSADWVTANCPSGDGVRDFAYCNRTTPISLTEVSGFYPAGTRFFNVAGTTEYTIANPFPNVAGPTTYKAQLPGGGCQLTFTIAVTTITSVPSVAAGTLEYCQNSPAVALTATPSNPSYTLYYYAPSNGATQPSIIPATDVVGTFTYQVAEGPSSTCISSNRADIPVTILELPTITATPEQPVCFGQTGSVVLASSGGTGALTYSAVNPATSGLTAGSYTYSVSDSKNCRSTATAVINAAPDQPAQPEIECWENASWNSITCQWDVTGEQPAQPSIECWENATFNNSTCSWDVTGEQPVQPSIECWENATFNNSTCSWDVTGEQPEQPSIECWENATFNNSTCSWDVTGEQPEQPSIECWENANFNNETCTWDVTGEQPAQPSIECWENATFNNATCSWDVTGEQPEQPSIECWENANFNNETCTWDVTGEQPAQPSIECWENATFNNSTCSWDVTGEQPAQPSIECWENATFNNATCSWDVTGEQPEQPSIECWENATFNNSTCSWDVTGEQPEQPSIECWENATFNNSTCSWDVTGEQPAQPSIECWENATFNNATCSWDVTGEQPEQPSIECWENATFNNSTCSWDVTGEQPAQPSIECWENATFNNATCSWDVTGEQPAQPSIECWENATFNNATCSWDVTGEQPEQPSIECWENATFNNSTCSWDVTGEQPEQPSIECWENTTFNNSTCSWDVTGEQPAQPSIECWENATFNNATCSWDVTGEQPEQPELACYEIASFNNETCIWDITIEDLTIPIISDAGANMTIECPETPEFTAPTAEDACGEVEVLVVSDNSTDGDCEGTYTRTITWKAVDEFGNESNTVSQTITVTDTTAPVFESLVDGVVSCEEGLVFNEATASDNCDSDVELTFVDEITCNYTTYSKGGWGSPSSSIPGQYRDNNFDGAFPSGLTIGCEVGSFTFTSAQAIEDFIPSGGGAAVLPAGNIVNPSADVFSNNFADQLMAAMLNTTFDAYDETFGGSDANLGDLAFASGTFAGMTANEVIAIANDAIGGCGASYSNVDLSAAMEAINLSFHEGTTNSGALACSFGENECSYTAIRTWTATDNCGNTSTAVQTITVVDEIAPSIGAPGASMVINCPEEPIFTAPTAEDNCSDATVLVISDETNEGECAGSYSRTITWVAEDLCGNRSESVSQTIIVIDITAPTISLLCGDTTITCPSEPVFAQPTASDDCDSNPAIIVISDETVDGPCAGTYARTIMWAAQDACGNISEEVSQTITVVDETAPTISAAGESTTIECPATPEFTAPTATDDCDSNPVVEVISNEIVEGSCAGSYTQTMTWVAYDACGNYSETVSQTITVVDTTAPSISAAGADATIECLATPEFTAPTANDTCGDAEVVVVSDVTTEACGNTYSRTISWKAVDACGNESETVSQTISVIDVTAPVVDSYSMEITVHCDQVPNIPVLTASDACSEVSVDFNEILYSGGCPGTIERNYIFTDACGNIAEATQFITIEDNVAPEFTFVPEARFFGCGETYTQPQAAEAVDICDPSTTISYTSTEAAGDCPQQQLIIHTWTATDDCQNETVVTVTDIITICPEVEEVTACDQYEWFGTVYTESGYYENVETENGCDVVYALELTINESETATIQASSCVSYNWNGTVYSASGSYTQVFENAAGCDSTVTLQLTIKQPSTSSQTASACGSYNWNGTTYTNSGVYTFVTTNAAGCDSTATLTLTMNTPSTAATSINASSTSIITGASVVLTVNGGSLGTGAVWKWYRGSCGGTFVGTGNSITVSPTSTTTYFVRAEGTCNTTTCISRTITVTQQCGPLSLVSNAPNNATCYGSAVTLTVGGTLQSGSSWKWYKNSCGGICVGTGTNLTVMPVCTTTYYVRSEGGPCGTTSCMSITIVVNNAPSRPAYITGLTSGLCNRTGVTYCTPAVTGATSYQWSVPTGATIVSGQGTTCITVNFSGALGSNSSCGYAAICVRAMNSCGLSQARCVNLYTAPSGFASLNGLSYVTQGTTTTYSLSNISGATSYNWVVPTGWTILNGQGTSSISVLTGHNSGYVKVTPSNACASGSMRMKYVIVNCPGFRDAEVNELEIPDAILYPNPANESFTIESGDALPTLVEVMDISGKVVFNGTGVRQVSTQQLSTGIYLVRIYFNDEIQTKRLEILH